MLCTPNNAHHYQVCQSIRCALVGGIIVPSMVSPAKPCSTPALLKLVLLKTTSCLATPILLNPCPSPSQTSPRSKPYPAQPHQSPAQTMPLLCPKPALLKQALLKPRPAQTTTCSTMSCSTIPAPRPHPAQTTPRPSPAQTSTPLKAIPCSTTPIPCSI